MDLTLKDLGSLIFGDTKNLFQHLQSNGLMPSRMSCPKCGAAMKIYVHGDKYLDIRWRCSVTRCGRSLTVKTGTCFSSMALPIQRQILVIYCWSQKLTNNAASIETDISVSTIGSLYQKLRDICEWRLGTYDSLPLEKMRPKKELNYTREQKDKFRRMKGCNHKYIKSYLNESIWFEFYGKTRIEAFRNICRDIALKCPVNVEPIPIIFPELMQQDEDVEEMDNDEYILT